MHTTAATAAAEIRSNRKSRRTARVLGAVAVGAALTAGLVGCGTGGQDAASTEASGKAPTKATEVADELNRSVDSMIPVDESTGTDNGQPGNGGGDGGGPIAPKPVIDTFVTPESIDCHNGNFQEFIASWTTTNADGVTVSIDGPGGYADYAADGEADLPFNCSSSHTFLLTAHGAGGTATRSITLDPRNVQGGPDEEAGDDDQSQGQAMPAGTSSKVAGGSTGTGTATDRDCEIMAQQQESLGDIAFDQLQGGDASGALATLDEASKVEDTGYNMGCFFVYT